MLTVKSENSSFCFVSVLELSRLLQMMVTLNVFQLAIWGLMRNSFHTVIMVPLPCLPNTHKMAGLSGFLTPECPSVPDAHKSTRMFVCF